MNRRIKEGVIGIKTCKQELINAEREAMVKKKKYGEGGR